MNLYAADINTGSALTVGDGTHSFHLNLTGGTVSAAQGIMISSTGHVTGVGTISGNVINNGDLAPGDAPGTITLLGDLTSTGALDFGLASTSSYDRLSLPAGIFTAGGTIDVSLLGGYEPSFGNSFKIMDFALLLDDGYQFDFSAAALRPGYSWDTSAFASSGIITAVPEPGAMSLIAMSGALLLGRRRSRA